MGSGDIAKGFRQRAMKDLKCKDILWKLEYSTALGWFGNYPLEKSYFSRELAAGCRKHLAGKRAAEKRPKNSPAVDKAFALIEDTMRDMIKNSIFNVIELVKVIVEISKEIDAEGEAYRRFMLNTPGLLIQATIEFPCSQAKVHIRENE